MKEKKICTYNKIIMIAVAIVAVVFMIAGTTVISKASSETTVTTKASSGTSADDEKIRGAGGGNVMQIGDTIYMSMCSGSIEGELKQTGIIAYNTKSKKVRILANLSIDYMFYYNGYIYGNDLYRHRSKASLYKINIKTGKYKKIASAFDGIINEENGRIYYLVNGNKDNQTLYVYDMNKNKRKKLVSGEISNIHFYKNKIFYNHRKDYNDYIYVMDANGKNKKILESGKLEDVVNNYVIYSFAEVTDEDITYIYQMKIDGTGDNFVTEGTYMFTESGRICYYVSKNDKKYYYSIKMNGTEKKKLFTDGTCFFTESGRICYYISKNDKKYYYSIKMDGTEKKKLYTNGNYILLKSGRIYYSISKKGKEYYYSIKLDGTGKKKVSRTQVEILYYKLHATKNSKSNYVYWNGYGGYGGYYGTTVQNNKVYFIKNSKLYCKNLKTKKITVLFKVDNGSDELSRLMGMVGKYIIIEKISGYEDKNWKREVYLYSTSGRKIKTLYSKKG